MLINHKKEYKYGGKAELLIVLFVKLVNGEQKEIQRQRLYLAVINAGEV